MTTKMWRGVLWILGFGFAGMLLSTFLPGRRRSLTVEQRIELWQTVTAPTVLAMLALAATIIWVLSRLRARKARRTWQLMGEERPFDTRYLVFVYQRTRHDLERLGWRRHGRGFAPVPIIGVAFGADITFWEAGHPEPTLRLRYADVHGIAFTEEAGDWPRPALAVQLDGDPEPSRSRREALRRRDLILSLRDADRNTVSEDEQMLILRQIEAKAVAS